MVSQTSQPIKLLHVKLTAIRAERKRLTLAGESKSSAKTPTDFNLKLLFFHNTAYVLQ